MEENEIDKMTPDARVYEVGYHIIPTVAEDNLGVRVTAVRDVVESVGGRMISDEYPKHIDLAYPMVKVTSNKRATHHSAYFGWMKFDAEPEGIKKLDEALKKDEYILRYILLKTVRENTMAPKKVLREKRAEEAPRVKEAVVEKPTMTEEELDKTIEELVIS
ncbi:MAG: hypothetical protein A3D65_02350 [Candidatus Lloydbacteria bacterium RIFCSPHIGHO2_02_FULL_50_13]|uniref:Small ribosomal subunit protein bS6 n=1 Tax=Candidatus Lloydbacteria bacterium RIFCSPHIGHO2_02_FULL_50_13 TaxID=1798661 RepID=A0A1G2D0H3_9BACT|nr:MAG: hypothetical protein A3D65_02350 [Candidatus Lloydbacteria bacterium RIFCSPHIGHO2_02_FULL_50_13]